MSEKIGQNGEEGMKSAGGKGGEEAFVESSCAERRNARMPWNRRAEPVKMTRKSPILPI